jgi:hypothetical protein
MKRVTMTLILMFAAVALGRAQSTIYLPEVVGGMALPIAWKTHIVVANGAAAGTGAASGTITFTQDNGTPMNISSFFIDVNNQVPAGTGNTILFSLSGGETRYFIMPDAPNVPLLSGYAKITSSLPLVVGGAFEEVDADTGNSLAMGGMTAAVPLARQAAIAIKTGDTSIGLAYANPNGADATVTFRLMTTTGIIFGQPIAKNVPANSHTSLFINELFADIPKNFFGSLQITTNGATPLIATTFAFVGNIFGTLPMIPLP